MYKTPLEKFVIAFSAICFFLCIIGIIAGFCNNYTILIICAGFSIINSILQILFGGQNNLSTEIITVIVGVIVKFIFGISLLAAISFSLCFAEIIFTLLGLVFGGTGF